MMKKEENLTIGIIALTGGDDVIKFVDGWARDSIAINHDTLGVSFRKQKILLGTFTEIRQIGK